MLIAHKTRLHPNNKQASFFRRCSGFRRYAYNWALAEIKREWEENEKRLSISDADKRFNQHKKGMLPWAYGMPSCVGQEAIKADLKGGLQHFFRRIKQGGEKPGFPRFKRKGSADSFCLTNIHLKEKHIEGNHIALPKKQGLVRLGDSVRFEGKLMSTTISRKGDKWYASFLVDVGDSISYSAAPENSAVGIDWGVAEYASLSNGEIFPAGKAFEKYRVKLLRAQRKLSRMQGPDRKKGIRASENWKKQAEKVRRIGRLISHYRENYAHQVTTDIASRFSMVAIENLKVQNMSKSAKGDSESPGKNVKAKSGLNRSILDGGFYQFRAMLEYKLERRGGVLIAVDPRNTSRTCPACGYVGKTGKENRKKRDTFKCIECDFSGHADVVAANNILMRATKELSA